MEHLTTIDCADANLTSRTELAAWTAPAAWDEPELVQVEALLGPLAGDGANCTLFLAKTADGQTVDYVAAPRVIGEASVARRFVFAPVRVGPGETLRVAALSSASADTAVDARVTFDAISRAGLGADALARIRALEVGSTPVPLPLGKALEVLLAVAAGVAQYDAESGTWTVLARDGATPVAVLTLAGSGNRPAVQIL